MAGTVDPNPVRSPSGVLRFTDASGWVVGAFAADARRSCQMSTVSRLMVGSRPPQGPIRTAPRSGACTKRAVNGPNPGESPDHKVDLGRHLSKAASRVARLGTNVAG